MVEWKPVCGFEDRYEVSSAGQVRNIKTGHVLALELSKGYFRVSWNVSGIVRHFLVHRLVAIAFIPNPENKPCIDHIDGNKYNNCVDNLRWCTHKENTHNPVTLEKQLEIIQSEAYRKHMSDVLVSPAVKQKRVEAHAWRMHPIRCIETGQIWRSLAEAAKATGLTRQAIAWSCRHAGRVRMRKLTAWHGHPILHFVWAHDSRPSSEQDMGPAENTK